MEYRGQLLDEIRSGRRVMSRIDNFTERTGIDFSDKEAIRLFIDDILISEGALDQVGSELQPAIEDMNWFENDLKQKYKAFLEAF